MTHRVRCHTSTGCLITALRTVNTWVKWAESLSTVRWVKETVLLLIWLVGWILRCRCHSGSEWFNMPVQFYSRSAFITMGAGGHCYAPNRVSLEWHSKPQNVAECGQYSTFVSSSFNTYPLLLSPKHLFSHPCNMTWHRNDIVMSYCDKVIDTKWVKEISNIRTQSVEIEWQRLS